MNSSKALRSFFFFFFNVEYVYTIGYTTLASELYKNNVKISNRNNFIPHCKKKRLTYITTYSDLSKNKTNSEHLRKWCYEKFVSLREIAASVEHILCLRELGDSSNSFYTNAYIIKCVNYSLITIKKIIEYLFDLNTSDIFPKQIGYYNLFHTCSKLRCQVWSHLEMISNSCFGKHI